jgi:hypothetical protein
MMGHPIGEISFGLKGHNDPSNMSDLRGIGESLMWNSAPVPGTDISRSLIVTGREFHFPIDFSASKHLSLTSSPTTANQYAVGQAQLLSACRLVAKEMIHRSRAMHRELINARRGNPRLYELGDKVFSRRAVRSDKKRGIVAKVHIPYTGPWEVIGDRKSVV